MPLSYVLLKQIKFLGFVSGGEVMDAACSINLAEKARVSKGSRRTGTATYMQTTNVFCGFFYQCRKGEAFSALSGNS